MPVRYTGVVTKMKKGRNFGFIEVIDDNTSFVYDNDIYFHSSYLNVPKYILVNVLTPTHCPHTHPPLTPTHHPHRSHPPTTHTAHTHPPLTPLTPTESVG